MSFDYDALQTTGNPPPAPPLCINPTPFGRASKGGAHQRYSSHTRQVRCHVDTAMMCEGNKSEHICQKVYVIRQQIYI